MRSGYLVKKSPAPHGVRIMAMPTRDQAIDQAVKSERKAMSLASKLARYNKQAKEAASRTMTVAISVGGAAAAGYISKKFPGQWMGIDQELILGGGLLAAGLLKLGGDKMSEPMLAAGSGILAAYAYNKTKAMK
jgi:hypothetical protein